MEDQQKSDLEKTTAPLVAPGQAPQPGQQRQKILLALLVVILGVFGFSYYKLSQTEEIVVTEQSAQNITSEVQASAASETIVDQAPEQPQPAPAMAEAVIEPPPTEDLPLEEMASTSAQTSESNVSAEEAIAVAALDANVEVSEPTDAEKAIAETVMNEPVTTNAVTNEVVSGQSAGTVSLDIAAQPIQAEKAIIRPMPESYVVVKKDHGVGEVDARIAAGRIAMSQNRNDAALALFTGLKKDYPRDGRVLMGEALSLQRLGQTESALSAYERVLEKDPENIEALTNMLGLLKIKDRGYALERLNELRNLYPSNPDITAQLGVLYAEEGNLAEAIKYLDMADSLKSNSAGITLNRAIVNDKLGNTAKAADLYRQVLRMVADGNIDQAISVDQIKARLSSLR